MKKSILLVDDHPVLRKGLASLLNDEEDMLVIGEASDGKSAIDLVEELSPDIVVMDVTMPGVNGIEATRQIIARHPKAQIVALSIHSEKQFVQDMLEAGASGYILKESVAEELIKGIRSVMLGEGYLSPAITGIVVSQFRESLSGGLLLQEEENVILTTKLYSPNMPEHHVHRQRLIDLLDKNIDLPVQAVTAPAGYGKSTLVGCWILQLEWQNAWISLDAGDNDLRQFVAYITHATRELFPTALTKTLAILSTSNLPPLQVFAKMVANELAEIHLDFILVLDDFHLITEKKVHDFMAELLHHPPKCFHLLVVGRTDPFLPLTKLRAQSQLAEIRLQELKFTTSEAADFLKEHTNQEIHSSTLATLLDKTEGWITGIRFAAISMLHRDNLTAELMEEIEGGQQAITEYLFSEVLTNLPDNIRDFLIATSLLDRFCAPLCEEIYQYTGQKDGMSGWKLVKFLKEKGLFLIALDSAGYWYRFHHLFQKLLEKQSKRFLVPEKLTALHVKASDWLAENNFIQDAIHHSLVAGNTGRAVSLFKQNRQTLHNEDMWYVLEKWLTLFPEEVVQQQPELLIARIWVHYHQFEVDAIPVAIDTIIPLLGDTPEDQTIRGEIDFFRGYFCYFQNDGLQAKKYLKNALKRVPGTCQEICGQIEIVYALTNQMFGNDDEAISRINESISRHQHEKSSRMTRLLVTPVYVNILSGNLDEALTLNHKLRHFSVKNNFVYAEAWSLYLKGLIHFYQDDIEDAATQFRQAADYKYILQSRASIDSMIGLALAYQEMRLDDKADEAMEELSDYVVSLNDPDCLAIKRFAEIRLQISRGKPFLSQKHAQMSTSAIENMVWWLEVPRLSYCRALLLEGSKSSLAVAEKILQELLQQNQKNHNVCQVIQVLPLLAMVTQKQGQSEEALKFLAQATNAAEPGRWVRPFVELGRPMEELLIQMEKKENPGDGYVSLLLHCFRNIKQKIAKHSSPIADSLTNREREILEQLSEGKANKEIAEKLFISVDTVKTHLKNIFEKLAVNNRLQAVAKANSLGLVMKTDSTGSK